MSSTKKICLSSGEFPPPSDPIVCLTQLMISEEMVDLTVNFPGHDDNFKVHRLVLGMWSRVFQVMLFGPMAEGGTITLEEDSPQTFKWVLNYMYTGELRLPSVELALQVYLFANKYLMAHLKTVCSKYLINQVVAERVPEVLNLAILLEDGDLIDKCVEVLEPSADSFFASPAIGSLSSDSLKCLLGKDLSVFSESVVFQGILNWCRSHLKSKEKEISPITLRQEMENFLPKIRFLTMSLEEFVKNVLPEYILTLEEVETITRKIAGVPEINLPPLFSTEKERRNRFHTSVLNSCQISVGVKIKEGLNAIVSNMDILAQIQPLNSIYLNRIEYEKAIGYNGKLSIKNSSDQVIQKAEFDGRIVVFDFPLQMLPEETYTFNLDCYKFIKLPTSYTIEDNDVISGNMMNNITKPFVLYYWE